jgi:hypothetical protein
MRHKHLRHNIVWLKRSSWIVCLLAPDLVGRLLTMQCKYGELHNLFRASESYLVTYSWQPVNDSSNTTVGTIIQNIIIIIILVAELGLCIPKCRYLFRIPLFYAGLCPLPAIYLILQCIWSWFMRTTWQFEEGLRMPNTWQRCLRSLHCALFRK